MHGPLAVAVCGLSSPPATDVDERGGRVTIEWAMWRQLGFPYIVRMMLIISSRLSDANI